MSLLQHSLRCVTPVSTTQERLEDEQQVCTKAIEDWNFFTTPEPNERPSEGVRRSLWTAPKSLGRRRTSERRCPRLDMRPKGKQGPRDACVL